MKTSLLTILLLCMALFAFQSFSTAEEEDRGSHAKEKGHEHGPDEDGMDEHGHAEGHGEEEEGSTKIGPDKGITEKGPLGFKLSAEAAKNIGFQTVRIDSATANIPCDAVVQVKADKFVFRSREGWLKKEPVEIAGRAGSLCNVQGKELQPGDLVVTTQTGFLRIAEIFLEEGASHSHSH